MAFRPTVGDDKSTSILDSQPAEELGAIPDGTGPGMADLARFVLARA